MKPGEKNCEIFFFNFKDTDRDPAFKYVWTKIERDRERFLKDP